MALTEILTKQERMCLYWLTRIPGFGAVTVGRIWNSVPDREHIYNIEGTFLQEKKLLCSSQIEAFETFKKAETRLKIEAEYEELKARNICFLTPFDEEYPKGLHHISGKPMGLYCRGQLPDNRLPSAAIVGARECSSYGSYVARILARELSSRGIQIVSGLALGIDSAGHRGALEAGAPTYGILGCGINICYPRENYQLFERMEAEGGILSEYGMGEKPRPANFPMRNRIISGIVDVVIVVEAREKSGSLITAELALEQGKDVFAVPGRVTDMLSLGCNRLIQSGAYPLLKTEDVLDYFGMKHGKIQGIQEKKQKGLAKKEKKVYICLDLQPKFIEEIVKESGLPMHECVGILLDLEMEGYVVQEANHYYRKNCE